MGAVIQFLLEHGLEILGGVVAVLLAVIALLKLIPGDQGEAKLQAIADFLSRLLVKR